jgi:chaperone modulatory protein CbpM
MNDKPASVAHGAVVEEDLRLSLLELSRACRVSEAQIRVLVVEGVLEPIGDTPHEWRFTGLALQRATRALRLTHDLELNPPGVALALDLLDEIAALRARLRRLGL